VRWIPICFVSLWVSSSGFAAEPRPLNLLLLRDVICEKESLGAKNRDWAFNGYQDVGRCQIRWETAYSIGGFERDRSPGDLFQRDTNERVAWNIIVRCFSRWKRPTPYLVGYCYHGGLYRKVSKGNPWDAYAKDIQQRYAERERSTAKN
jgi:hypothetical protein